MIKKLIPLLILMILSCNNDDSQNNSNKDNILNFSFVKNINTNLTQDVKGKIDYISNTVTLKLPFNTDITELIPSIELPEGASISPSASTTLNFSDPITFTLKIKNEIIKEYVVSAIVDDISMNMNTSGEFLETVYYSPFNSTDDLIEIIKYDSEKPIARFREVFNNNFNSYDEIFVEPIYARNIELFEYGSNNKVSKVKEFPFWKLEEGYEFKFENNKVFTFNKTTGSLIDVTNNSSYSISKTVNYDNEDKVVSSVLVHEWGAQSYHYQFNSSNEIESIKGGDQAIDFKYSEGVIELWYDTFPHTSVRAHSGFLNGHPLYGTGSYPPKVELANNPEYNLFLKYGLARYGNYMPYKPFIEASGEFLDQIEGTERYVNEVNSFKYPIMVTEIKNKAERTVGYSYR
ncbi:hypothetical protein [Pareuzebyella sediminis]|uniref:hypothetical protein n=1 Tax=Pareuzebyella sediminis TaxID=2607998 RepID=UPI0011EDF863|nr:hypothetical protein [Pareuzebyella sediminis]